jgi:hypothetical protein
MGSMHNETAFTQSPSSAVFTKVYKHSQCFLVVRIETSHPHDYLRFFFFKEVFDSGGKREVLVEKQNAVKGQNKETLI